jgi:hypothetical protein
MKIVESELSKKIISKFIPEPILSTNPVVAGGFALSLYLTVLAANDPLVSSVLFAGINNPSQQTQLLCKFSDIDIWYLDSSDFLKSEESNVFFSDPKTNSDDSTKTLVTLNNSNSKTFSIQPGSKTGIRCRMEKSSVWANTFRFMDSNPKNYSHPVQFIRKHQKDVESLIKSFDLKISSVAWMDGSFYIADGFEESLKNKVLELNDGQLKRLKKQRFGTKIFQSLRIFKYLSRFNFEFSKELFGLMVENMTLASDYLLKLEEAKASNPKTSPGILPSRFSGSIPVTSSNGNYVESIVNTATMEGMCRSLCSHFESLSKMSHWDDSIALFFANSKAVNIRTILDKNLNSKAETPDYVIPF